MKKRVLFVAKNINAEKIWILTPNNPFVVITPEKLLNIK